MRARKKCLAAALSVVMAAGSLPMTAMAATAPEGTTGWFYDEDRGGGSSSGILTASRWLAGRRR